MPRVARIAPSGVIYHALNRACRATLIAKESDYEAFERTIVYAQEKVPTRILAYCVMPNHWHFVLWPCEDGELTAFLRRLAHTHTQRWHAHHGTAGTGHLYQGRFKSFPVQDDETHLCRAMRYVERNAWRVGLVVRPEQWRWGSLGRRGRAEAGRPVLHPSPVPLPDNWVEEVNAVESPAELEALRRSLRRGTPFGGELWQRQTADQLGLGRTLCPRGRPRTAVDG